MTAHRSAQIVRLSAIVASGAASLCLTVAAGAYIVNHMPALAPPPATEHAAPVVTPNPGHHRPLPADDSAPTSTVDLVMFTGESTLRAERSADELTPTPLAAQQSGARLDNSALAGRLGIGGTYLGAQVAPARSDTYAFTVDTNLVTTAARYLGMTPDPAAVTAVRTEFDSRQGELVVILSDPRVGSHTLRVEKPAPVPEMPESPTEQLPTTVDV
ncbi:hypothetical protein [Nocardia sp. NPDC058666]|uniref:hypothetical protein n=1 Tax=Nocardia sp. NPDC058666 TaxID=3346587 RepID=UPI00365C9245